MTTPGRPTKYQAEYAEQAFKLCLLGMTDVELAQYFEVAESTIHLWKLEHPEFSESITRGKVTADAEVSVSLYKRAKGYEHEEDKIFLHEGQPVVVPTIKRYPPDYQSARFWLHNRQGHKWRDKQEIEHSGPDGGPIEISATDALRDYLANQSE